MNTANQVDEMSFISLSSINPDCPTWHHQAMRLVLTLAILFGSCNSWARAPDLKLFFEDAEPFDLQCNSLKQDENYKITQGMRDELHQRIPNFGKTWRDQSAGLVDAMSELLKHPYGRREETIALTLCQWFSPMSSPLILRAREYLKSTAEDNPKGPQELKPESYFVGQVFHELIHRYLDRYFPDIGEPSNSALLKKHASESEAVLIHLHHLSVQKAIYLKLHRDKELAIIIDLDSKIRGGVYKRAWEIVTEDGYEKYVAELQTTHKNK